MTTTATTTTTVLIVLVVISGAVTSTKHHSHTHKKHDVTSTQPLHTSKLKVIAQNNTARRSIWDTINNANISVENSVHSYTAKSEVAGQVADPTRRDIWDTINNANISVENSVHSYTTKSDIGAAKPDTKKTVTANSTRRDVWDLIKGANLTIVNSVHSQMAKKCKGHCPKQPHHVVSNFHGSKPRHVKEEVGLRRSSIVSVAPAQKRDEEPGLGGEESGPDPVSVRGKSPSDVAA